MGGGSSNESWIAGSSPPLAGKFLSMLTIALTVAARLMSDTLTAYVPSSLSTTSTLWLLGTRVVKSCADALMI